VVSDAKKEELERFVGSMTPEDRKGFIGKVNQWTKADGVRLVPASQSVYDLNSKQKRLREFGESKVLGEDLAPIIKRTSEQRVEAMAQRLLGAYRDGDASVEFILKDIAGEYWKQGMPVAVEDLRTVAAHYLNRTERKKK
jgi:hypothetical protein